MLFIKKTIEDLQFKSKISSERPYNKNLVSDSPDSSHQSSECYNQQHIKEDKQRAQIYLMTNQQKRQKKLSLDFDSRNQIDDKLFLPIESPLNKDHQLHRRQISQFLQNQYQDHLEKNRIITDNLNNQVVKIKTRIKERSQSNKQQRQVSNVMTYKLQYDENYNKRSDTESSNEDSFQENRTLDIQTYQIKVEAIVKNYNSQINQLRDLLPITDNQEEIYIQIKDLELQKWQEIQLLESEIQQK